jgi:heme/copper-type cytochrome/quinol oxidase subunit 2
MSAILWAVVGIAGVILLLLAVFLWKLKRQGWKHEPDYRTFFIIGITWLPLGIILDFPVFYILGLVYLAIGLANRDKWKEKKPFTQGQKMLTVAGVVVLVIALLAAFLLVF